MSDLLPADDDLELTIRCQREPTVSLRLHSRHFPDESGVAFAVDVRADGLYVDLPGVELWAWDGAVADFVTQLAADYRGWSGERLWRSDQLTLRASFHSRGHVALTWDLKPFSTRHPAWQVSITTWLEAGEQMSSLAAGLGRFLAQPPKATDVSRQD